MKKLEIFTRPEKLEGLKELLTVHKCQGMSVFTVMGCGKQKGYVPEMNFTEFAINLLPKICIISIIDDDELEELLNDIYSVMGNGNIGDGKVFVYDVYEAMRIRTGERGSNAL
ncbi:MAG TPA: P-II family nitrogen regulator [Lachnospiraceae bacterium]|nr:P-II family nitrogen regulator [Lachnospiraceae bacterium]